MNYRIYEPCKRVVEIGGGYGREHFYSFPKMIFWKRDGELYCGYMGEDDYIYLPKCGNINYNFRVCLGDFESDDLNELIERFWQTDFGTLEIPNISNIETKAKLNLEFIELDDYETTNFDFAYEYLMYNKKRCSKLENLIKTIPCYACNYASRVIKDRWLEAEEYIKTDNEYAYIYALEVIKGRWLEAEEYIKTSINYSCYYAIDVMKKRWLDVGDEDAENDIKTSNYHWGVYKNHFNINE